jgi:CheY-like chemotaxis protein
VARPAALVTRHSIEESRRRGARVLLVEDNDVNRTVAQKLLERMGHTVDVARDGREAVDATRATAYDVVLMDVQMPVLDGYQATIAIRRREGGTTHVPIVAMTANAMAGDREKCLAVGMDDYLPKPVRPEDLSAAIERAWARPASLAEAAAAPRSLRA